MTAYNKTFHGYWKTVFGGRTLGAIIIDEYLPNPVGLSRFVGAKERDAVRSMHCTSEHARKVVDDWDSSGHGLTATILLGEALESLSHA